MFYVTTLKYEVELEPKFFGQTLHETITRLVKVRDH